MNKRKGIDDKIFSIPDIKTVSESDIRKNPKTYQGSYFVDANNMRGVLQDLEKSFDPIKNYFGKDIQDKIRRIYQKL